jgi:hypothetical protein
MHHAFVTLNHPVDTTAAELDATANAVFALIPGVAAADAEKKGAVGRVWIDLLAVGLKPSAADLSTLATWMISMNCTGLQGAYEAYVKTNLWSAVQAGFPIGCLAGVSLHGQWQENLQKDKKVAAERRLRNKKVPSVVRQVAVDAGRCGIDPENEILPSQDEYNEFCLHAETAGTGLHTVSLRKSPYTVGIQASEKRGGDKKTRAVPDGVQMTLAEAQAFERTLEESWWPATEFRCAVDKFFLMATMYGSFDLPGGVSAPVYLSCLGVLSMIGAKEGNNILVGYVVLLREKLSKCGTPAEAVALVTKTQENLVSQATRAEPVKAQPSKAPDADATKAHKAELHKVR